MSKNKTVVHAIGVFLVFQIFTADAFASCVELLVWQSTPTAPKIVLPQLLNETAEGAVSRYLTAVDKDSDLMKMPGHKDLSYGIYSLDTIGAVHHNSSASLIFLANTFDDMSPEGQRIQRNIRTFSRAGAVPYVLAISADLGLTDTQANCFRNLIATRFNLMVALGGEDVSEELSGRVRRDDSKTIFRRDVSELAMIKKFKEVGLGVFFGICRGHQIGAIADGHTVIEDLSESGMGQTRDHIDKSASNITMRQTWHHLYVEDKSLLARLTGVKNDASGIVVKVNSLHHQAVDPKPNALSDVVARHETSGVEALQMKNGRGLSVQFHPEFPPEISGDNSYSAFGFGLIRNVVAYSRLVRVQSSKPKVCELFLN